MGGVAGYLFLPLAEAVIFAMVASFILSRTLTPTVANWLLRGQVAAQRDPTAPIGGRACSRDPEGLRSDVRAFPESVSRSLGRLADRRNVFVSLYLAASVVSLSLPPICRRRLLSRDQVWHDGPARSLPGGHPDRGNGEVRDPGGRSDTRPAARSRDRDACQLRPARKWHQSGVQRQRTIGRQDCDITISLDIRASPVATYRQVYGLD